MVKTHKFLNSLQLGNSNRNLISNLLEILCRDGYVQIVPPGLSFKLGTKLKAEQTTPTTRHARKIKFHSGRNDIFAMDITLTLTEQ